MIFETLHEAAQRGELLLVDGGFCHWHLRRDGQLTIREIIATRHGAGSVMLARLLDVPGVQSILAKCPADLRANAWYAHKGFVHEATETTPSGRVLNVWRLPCSSTAPVAEVASPTSPSPQGSSTAVVAITSRHILWGLPT